jgi:hypothetical protein
MWASQLLNVFRVNRVERPLVIALRRRYCISVVIFYMAELHG